jgi:SOS-response transcriptional repressor LexA
MALRTGFVGIPVKGTVPAVMPCVEGKDGSQEYAYIANTDLHKVSRIDDLYALRVTDNSLGENEISAGDVVIIDPNAQFFNGQIFIVGLKGKCIACHVYAQCGHVRLVSSGYDRDVSYGECKILGRVILSGKCGKNNHRLQC